ncbi:MAG: hypothetical protein JOZ62_17545, partial [Acidobacteriaceae bacterium]|nr:hypothetical protein [Acidobacteriaceae bacterium]
MSVRDSFNKWLAAVLCFTSAMPVTFAQETQEEAILPVSPRAPLFIRPYTAAYVPPIQMANSGRLASLIRAGKLYLTVQDAIALALENNIDIEVARYTPILDAWNVERAEAGGALPGVPSGQSQARTVIRGQGVRGSQAAAGVSTGTGATTGNNTQNATISQIGPVTPALDPIFQNATTFSHLSQPQYNLRQSLVTNLIDNQRNYTTTLQQGFLSGGQATITYTAGYLNENSPTDILNPQFAVNMQLSIQQNFLQGFGTAVNSRT